MTTVFKVGDVVRLKNDPEAPGRRVISAVSGARVECDVYYPTDNKWNNKWTCTADQLELVSRTAPATFASCTDPGTPPACVNEVPKPTRLEAARAALIAAVQRTHTLTGHTTRALADELVAAAKAEAIAQRQAPEPKPYGRVLATASATCDYRHRKGDDVEMTFTVLVPAHAAIACAPIHETNYRVTATSKGER
jgi:hypothetical protein